MRDTSLILLVIGVASAFVTLILTPAVIRRAIARDLTDAPGGRKIHACPVPRLGGVAVFAGTAVGVALGAWALRSLELSVPRPLLGACLGGVIVFCAGLADDLRGLTPRAKFAAQLAAGTVAWSFGIRIEALAMGTLDGVAMGWMAFPLTIFWIAAVTNALNLIDGLDGLASGIGLVALTATLIAAIALGQFETAILAVALASALLGFLRFNVNPARIFLGDSGSLFIGYSLAVLSVHAAQRSPSTILVILPLSALALPLFDTTLAIARRWLRGMAFSEADSRHIHHRLLARGFTQRQAVSTLCTVAALIAALGVSATFVPGLVTQQVLPTMIWIFFPFVVIAGVYHLDYHEFAHAVAVLVAGPRRLRRVIRERIMVSELAQCVSGARSSEELDAMLARCCDDLEMRGIEIGRPGEAIRRHESPLVPLVRLEYPLEAPDAAAPVVLRIWCHAHREAPLANAERIAATLAPAIESWLEKNGTHAPTRVPVSNFLYPREIHPLAVNSREH